MTCNVKNLLEFGFFCDINQPLPWHPILACQMLSGLNLKTAILISTLTLAKFLWYDERFCKEKSVRWKTQNPIWKVFDIAGLVLSETAVKTSLVLEIRCRKNLMKLYLFIMNSKIHVIIIIIITFIYTAQINYTVFKCALQLKI